MTSIAEWLEDRFVAAVAYGDRDELRVAVGRLRAAHAQGRRVGEVLRAEVMERQDARLREKVAELEAEHAFVEGEAFGFTFEADDAAALQREALALQIFLELGLVSAAAAERLLARLELALTEGPPAPGQAPEEDVRAYVEERLRALGAYEDDGGFQTGRALAWAASETGLLTPRAAEKLIDSITRPLIRRQSAEVEGPGPGAIVRVIIGPPERRRGVRLLAVEIREGAVILHLDAARLPRQPDGTWPALPDERLGPASPGWPRLPELTLSDDRGTRYRGHVNAESWERRELYPAPPPEATRLVLAGDDVAFTILLEP
ncbi:MAG: hypothetical protein ACR2NB_13880 [Solirubrobacteraceae bacterium]